MGGWVVGAVAGWVVASVVLAVLLAATVRLRERHDVRPRLRRPERSVAPRTRRGDRKPPRGPVWGPGADHRSGAGPGQRRRRT